jgi:hypothetical protein
MTVGKLPSLAGTCIQSGLKMRWCCVRIACEPHERRLRTVVVASGCTIITAAVQKINTGLNRIAMFTILSGK